LALEWDQGFSAQLRAARPALAAQLRATWQGINPTNELTATLAATLAWEADLVHEVGPATNLWLQNGLGGNVGNSVQYWHNRFAQWLVDPALATNTRAALHQIGANAHAIGNQAFRVWDHEFGSDERWLAMIDQGFAADANGWMVIVLGSFHTTLADDRTLWNHFTQLGRAKRRKFACLRPPVDWG